MPARWSTRERPATAEELNSLRRQRCIGAEIGGVSVFVVPLALVGYAMVTRLSPWFGVLAALLCVAAAVGIVTPFVRFLQRHRARLGRDLQRAQIEILEVDDATAVSIPSDHDSLCPAYAFELTGGRTLVMMGQWLWDPRVYGCEADLDGADADEQREGNGLPAPFSYPATAFTVHRFPVSGEVLRIEVRGDYAEPPVAEQDIDLRPIGESQSRLLDCPLAGLAQRVRESDLA